ncbi:MAG: rod shape-determining protein RodA [Elusimicrobia bacterium RIFOXYB2_FULL_49_7]|nr:MAG: rod shape-determining protein RodA [Elusimicrobia bacterium RIFOXYB2_FULL_49_7]
MLAQMKHRIDLPAAFIMYGLIMIGIALIYSATHLDQDVFIRNLFHNQLAWVVLGTAAFYITAIIPSRTYYDTAYLFYAFTLLLLVLVVVKGTTAMGATRWIVLGPLRLQPSELAKIGTVFALARYLSSKPVSLEKISSLIVPFAMVMVPMLLIVKQPDLSTALVFCAFTAVMLFWGGLSLAEVFFLLSPILSLILAFHLFLWALFFIILFFTLTRFCRNLSVITIILSLNFMVGIILPMAWGKLHDYQKNRILTFVDPQRDPSGAGYQVLQSQVAIGSGKFLGKGFLEGTQTRLSFLPEQHTDFIFSVLGEQFGFIGCLFVLLLFLALILRLFFLAGEGNNRFLNLCVIGVAAQLVFHICVNTAMTVGMMPVTGLPLPFLSYGGNFLISCMALVGFAASIRKKNQEY